MSNFLLPDRHIAFVFCLLPIACCLLPVADCLLSFSCCDCLLLVVYYVTVQTWVEIALNFFQLFSIIFGAIFPNEFYQFEINSDQLIFKFRRKTKTPKMPFFSYHQLECSIRCTRLPNAYDPVNLRKICVANSFTWSSQETIDSILGFIKVDQIEYGTARLLL